MLCHADYFLGETLSLPTDHALLFELHCIFNGDAACADGKWLKCLFDYLMVNTFLLIGESESDRIDRIGGVKRAQVIGQTEKSDKVNWFDSETKQKLVYMEKRGEKMKPAQFHFRPHLIISQFLHS